MAVLVKEKIEIMKIGDIHPDFEDNIENIKSIEFRLLYGWGAEYLVKAFITNKDIIFAYPNKRSYRGDKTEFIEKLRELNISDWAWFTHFKKSERLMPGIDLWRMTIEYKDDMPPVRIYGDCDCPDNFVEFITLMGFFREGKSKEEKRVVNMRRHLLKPLFEEK